MYPAPSSLFKAMNHWIWNIYSGNAMLWMLWLQQLESNLSFKIWQWTYFEQQMTVMLFLSLIFSDF